MLLNIQLLACSITEDSHIQPDALIEAVQQGRQLVIVDVRSEAEYKTGHVPGAIHIPFWRTFTSESVMQLDKKEMVILYCAHGPRAGVAKLAFSWRGFNDLRYLSGHMSAWSNSGLPVAN